MHHYHLLLAAGALSQLRVPQHAADIAGFDQLGSLVCPLERKLWLSDVVQHPLPASRPEIGIDAPVIADHEIRTVRLGQLAFLVFGISTLLFFLLRLTGDPSLILVGDLATEESIERVREFYGLEFLWSDAKRID